MSIHSQETVKYDTDKETEEACKTFMEILHEENPIQDTQGPLTYPDMPDLNIHRSNNNSTISEMNTPTMDERTEDQLTAQLPKDFKLSPVSTEIPTSPSKNKLMKRKPFVLYNKYS